MKKYLLILIICVLVLAAVLTAVLIILNANGEVADDPDCRYIYTYTKKGNDILVTVTGGESAYTWMTETDGGNTITVTEAKAKTGKTAFLVKPGEEGYGILMLKLTKPETLIPDCLYVIRIDFLTEEGKLTVLDNTHKELSAPERYEANADYPFVFSNLSDGRLYLLAEGWKSDAGKDEVTGDLAETNPTETIEIETDTVDQSQIAYHESEWTALYDTDIIVVNESDREEGALFTVSTVVSDAKTDLYLVPPGKDGTALVLTLQIGSEGTVSILQKKWDTVDLDARKKEDKQKEIARSVGDVVLPSGAVYVDGNTMALPGELGTTYMGAWTDFTANNVTWTYISLPGAPVSPLLSYWRADESTAEQVTVDTVTGQFFETEYGMLVVWTTDAGSCSICASGVTKEQVVTVASAMISANGVSEQ